MIAVIQCAGDKRDGAGYLRMYDDQKVKFVGNPDADDVPTGEACIYARPDDVSDTEKSWRTVLREYNDDPGDNRYGLLQAWKLYSNETYGILKNNPKVNHLYILSAGWGLIPASFLTPWYNITFRGPQHSYKHRAENNPYEDFSLLPSDALGPIVFFGSAKYIPLFCKLTADTTNQRIVFYAGKERDAPGCTLRRYGEPFTNWHYACAKDYVAGRIEP